jgi:hypothetical protein
VKASYLKALTSLVLIATFTGSQTAYANQPVSGISTTQYNEGTDKAAEFYNPLVVSNVSLTLPQASVDALNSNPGTTVYQHASVVITTADNKVTTMSDIGIRIKGQATRTNLNGKTALKLKFDAFVAGQKFMGLTRMTLNSMVQDPSFVHEDSAYRLYRAMGVVAPRTTYSWVNLNGADYGLYMNVESVDSQMLKRWIEPKHLYSSNCYLADITPWQSGCYDTNYGDTDRTDLNAAIATSNLDGAAWWTEINKVADMTAVINLMATDLYTSNWDGYTDVVQNNYYLAFDTAGKFRIIPWGQDGAFPMDSSAQLDFLGRGPAFRNFGNQQRSVLLRKCVAYDPCTSLLVKAQVLAKQKAEQLDMPGFKNKIAAVINSAYISHETRSNSDVNSAAYWQNWLDTFFPMRTAALKDFLLTRAPEPVDLTITGSPILGSTLQASAVTWDFSSTIGYQWFRDGAPIANANTSSYTITAPDLGHTVSLQVSANKPNFTSAVTNSQNYSISNPKAAAAAITGAGKVGAALTATPKANDSIAVQYRWYRAGKLITGANTDTYTPTYLDYLKAITVTTVVNQAGFAVNTTTSKPVTIQAGTQDAPVVAIAGGTAMAQTALVNATIPYGVKASYQWLNDGVPISGATRTSYTFKAPDVGHNVSVRVTLNRTAYTTLVVTTYPVAVIAGTQVKQPIISITGLAKVSKTLTGVTGSWDSGVKLSYQWLRDGIVIPNAVAKTYKVTAADVGHSLVFKVTSTKPGYTNVVISSAPTLAAIS